MTVEVSRERLDLDELFSAEMCCGFEHGLEAVASLFELLLYRERFHNVLAVDVLAFDEIVHVNFEVRHTEGNEARNARNIVVDLLQVFL